MAGLGFTAATTGDPMTAGAAYTAMAALIHPFFPVMAFGALASGVILSVGTKRGLFKHYWIVVKLVLNVAVILTGATVVGPMVERAALASSASPAAVGTTAALLPFAVVTNLLLLTAATVVSVYKPWGRTRGRGGGRPSGAAARPIARKRTDERIALTDGAVP